MLSRNIGPRAVDEIVPSLVSELDAAANEDDLERAQRVVEGIREVLNASANTISILHHLIPQLISVCFHLYCSVLYAWKC